MADWHYNNNYIHPQRIHPAFECGLKIFIFQQFFSMTCAQGGKLLLALVHHEYMLYKLVMCIRSYFIPSLNVHFYVDLFRVAGAGEWKPPKSSTPSHVHYAQFFWLCVGVWVGGGIVWTTYYMLSVRGVYYLYCMLAILHFCLWY